ncbi:MAG: hypothetical protein LBK54_07165 [Propionibacteriaceae bacterium]|jgi:hypothetical protein|nr:hypothetical protein [Propionibacteriaceae bacterium]
MAQEHTAPTPWGGPPSAGQAEPVPETPESPWARPTSPTAATQTWARPSQPYPDQTYPDQPYQDQPYPDQPYQDQTYPAAGPAYPIAGPPGPIYLAASPGPAYPAAGYPELAYPATGYSEPVHPTAGYPGLVPTFNAFNPAAPPVAPRYPDPAWPSAAPPAPYHPRPNAAAPLSNTLGVVALIMSILTALAAALFGFGLFASEVGWTNYTDYPDYSSLDQFSFSFPILSLFGFASLIIGVVATATNRGRTQGVIAIIVSLLAPLIAVMSMILGLSLVLA